MFALLDASRSKSGSIETMAHCSVVIVFVFRGINMLLLLVMA